eukprot:2560832-Amphidinium_carterae.1
MVDFQGVARIWMQPLNSYLAAGGKQHSFPALAQGWVEGTALCLMHRLLDTCSWVFVSSTREFACCLRGSDC